MSVKKGERKQSTIKQIRLRHGGYSLLTIVFLLGILIIINLLSHQFQLTYDLTETNVFSLSKPSKKLLDRLEEDIKIISLSESGSEPTNVERILAAYQNYSNDVTVEYLDPELQPHLVSQYQEPGVTLDYGSVIIEANDQHILHQGIDLFNFDQQYERIESYQVEPLVTQAILSLIEPNTATIYTLVGHDEIEIPEKIYSRLELENYQIEELHLLRDDWQPNEDDIVLLNSLKKDITTEELSLLRDYLEQGGHVVLLFDIIDQDFPNLFALLESYGVRVNQAMVFENSRNHTLTDHNFYLIPELSPHSILDTVSDSNYTVITAQAQPIEILDLSRDTLKIEPLLVTSDQSYAKSFETMQTETNMEQEEGDMVGPFNIALAITDHQNNTDSEQNGQFVIFSSSVFTNDQFVEVSNQANADLLLNTMNWLSDREESLSIPPKEVGSETLSMHFNHQITIAIVVILVIPIMIMIIGLVVWYRRKNL